MYKTKSKANVNAKPLTMFTIMHNIDSQSFKTALSPELRRAVLFCFVFWGLSLPRLVKDSGSCIQRSEFSPRIREINSRTIKNKQKYFFMKQLLLL